MERLSRVLRLRRRRLARPDRHAVRRLEFSERRLLRRAPARIPRVLPSEHVSGHDHDGRPDLFVTALSNETYALYHNDGEGLFSFVSVPSGVAEATAPYAGWGTRWVDLDNDGWKDLFVAQGHVLDTIELTSDHLTYLQPPLLLKNI